MFQGTLILNLFQLIINNLVRKKLNGTKKVMEQRKLQINLQRFTLPICQYIQVYTTSCVVGNLNVWVGLCLGLIQYGLKNTFCIHKMFQLIRYKVDSGGLVVQVVGLHLIEHSGVMKNRT